MPKSLTFLVRRTPNHACVAQVKIIDTEAGPRMVLNRLGADSGPVPDVSDITGLEWETRAALRNEIKTRMRTIGPEPQTGLERVQAHNERMREAGLKLVREWVPAGRVEDLRWIAREMRDTFLLTEPERKR